MRKGYIIIILFGLVSLFADITYEGARSGIGPFFKTLGATSIILGSMAGLSDLSGYLLRLLSGIISDKTKKYWTLTFIGYFINLFSVPLLALTGNWETASILIIMERMGKGIRTPPRDYLLSQVSSKIGVGKAFGLHELLDQIGAVLGPLIISFVLAVKHDYRLGFLVLILPAILSMLFLYVAWKNYFYPSGSSNIIVKKTKLESKHFVSYLFFVFVTTMGFFGFILFSFHIKNNNLLPDYLIPSLYSLSMVVDGVIAFPIGVLFDKYRLKTLLFLPIFMILIPALAFTNNIIGLILSSIILGISLGIQETLFRASIPLLVKKENLGSAYGLMYVFYGVGLGLANFIIGLLYHVSTSIVTLYIVVVEALAFVLLSFSIKRTNI